MFKDTNGNKAVSSLLSEGTAPRDFIVYSYSYCDQGLPALNSDGLSYKPNKHGRVFFYIGSSVPAQPSCFREGIDLIVWDQRDNNPNNANNPNMKMISSIKISDESQQHAIAKTMVQYNRDHPSEKEWRHTEETIVKEWGIHNLGWGLVGLESCIDADIDNDDLGSSFIDYVRRVIR